MNLIRLSAEEIRLNDEIGAIFSTIRTTLREFKLEVFEASHRRGAKPYGERTVLSIKFSEGEIVQGSVTVPPGVNSEDLCRSLGIDVQVLCNGAKVNINTTELDKIDEDELKIIYKRLYNAPVPVISLTEEGAQKVIGTTFDSPICNQYGTYIYCRPGVTGLSDDELDIPRIVATPSIMVIDGERTITAFFIKQ